MGEGTDVEGFVAALADNDLDLAGVKNAAAADIKLYTGEHRSCDCETTVSDAPDRSCQLQWLSLEFHGRHVDFTAKLDCNSRADAGVNQLCNRLWVAERTSTDIVQVLAYYFSEHRHDILIAARTGIVAVVD